MDYLPIEKEIKKLTRSYLGNVIYTIVGEAFVEWVDSRINDRNAKIQATQNNIAYIDPEIAAILQNSTTISGK